MELKTLQCADVQNQIKHNHNGDSEMIPKQRRPGWQYWAVADLFRDGVLDIGDGYRAKNSEMGESGLPFARAGNLNNGFHFDDADILSEESVRLAGSKISKSGDITFTSKGTFGRFAMVRENTPRFVYSPQLCYWRVKQDGIVDRSFLYYWMQGDDCMNQLNEVKGLTDMADYVSLTNQRRMWLSAPPLPVQRRIAGILSAYDELIENSQRRIRILEEMARALYREWFVHFRFPSHENHPLVTSSLGDIPQGWEVKTVADSFAISGGGTPSRKQEEYWGGGTIQWFSPTDLTGAGSMFIDNSRDHITGLGLAKSSARLFPAGSVMLTSRATIGAIAINTHEACTNQGFIICLPNDRVPRFFLFHWLKENVPTFHRMASGATFKEISRGVFKTIEFLNPPAKVVRHFEDVVAPMAEQALVFQRQIQNLRQTRDLLLPRFLSRGH